MEWECQLFAWQPWWPRLAHPRIKVLIDLQKGHLCLGKGFLLPSCEVGIPGGLQFVHVLYVCISDVGTELQYVLCDFVNFSVKKKKKIATLYSGKF